MSLRTLFRRKRPKVTIGNHTDTMPYSPGIVYQLSPAPGERCIICNTAITNGFLVCSIECAERQLQSTPLVPLRQYHRAYKDVVSRLRAQWKHSTSAPTVRAVYAVITSELSNTTYLDYRAQVESKRHCTRLNFRPGNERLRWHGSFSKCDLANIGTKICGILDGCPLCSILRESFKVEEYQGGGLFGRGIYSTATSSKADNHAHISRGSYRALTLASVVAGYGKQLSDENHGLTEPPAGYDAVLGIPRAGGTFLYDETVVYDNDAIRPVFLVVYG